MTEENRKPEETAWLDELLDATSNAERYEIVCRMQYAVTDRLIDDIATVLDLSIPDGDLDERYRQLKDCLRTKQRYESDRFR